MHWCFLSLFLTKLIDLQFKHATATYMSCHIFKNSFLHVFIAVIHKNKSDASYYR